MSKVQDDIRAHFASNPGIGISLTLGLVGPHWTMGDEFRPRIPWRTFQAMVRSGALAAVKARRTFGPGVIYDNQGALTPPTDFYVLCIGESRKVV